MYQQLRLHAYVNQISSLYWSNKSTSALLLFTRQDFITLLFVKVAVFIYWCFAIVLHISCSLLASKVQNPAR